MRRAQKRTSAPRPSPEGHRRLQPSFALDQVARMTVASSGLLGLASAFSRASLAKGVASTTVALAVWVEVSERRRVRQHL